MAQKKQNNKYAGDSYPARKEVFRVAKTVADVEKKIEVLDETGEIQKGRSWKFWVVTPLVLATVGCGAFLVVRRLFSNSGN